MTDTSFVRKYQNEILLAAILLLSAFLNCWNIWTQGYTNTYYAAAVRSMLENPGVLFFNSFDAGGFVTVDKPPVGLWVQAASALIFGFSGWALVLPQALAGVGSVALLYCIVSRPFGKTAGLIAAFALAVTPIFVAVSRNGTMDGLLIFVLLLALWTALKAARENSLPYLLLAFTLIGLGFNIKMIQAYIAVPAVIAVYLLGAGGLPWKKRILHLILALAVLAAVSLSWALVIDSIPAEQRPYIGGSGDNTVMGLIINYNGIHRLESDGQSPGSGGPQANGNLPPGTRFLRNQTEGSDSGLPLNSRTASGTGGSAPPDIRGTMQPGIPGSPGSLPSAQNLTPDRTSGRMAPGPGRIFGQDTAPALDSFQSGSVQGMTSGQGTPGSRSGGGMDETGSPGLFRLFGSGLAGQLSWLIPFALFGLIAWLRKPSSWSLKGLEDTGCFSERGITLIAICLWLFPGLIYFSFTTGFWHTYYLATIAPPLAALVGIGAAGMYLAFIEGKKTGWILVGAILITGLIQAGFLLGSTLIWSEGLVLVLVTGVAGFAFLLATLVFTPRNRAGLIPKIIAGAAIGFLFIAPCIWACTPLTYGSGNFLPVAGPQLAKNGGGGPGSNAGPGSGSSGSGLTDYLVSHQTGETWIVAVGSSMQGADIIISTGKPVMALGGFSGSDQILTSDSLRKLISSGKIRYFLTSGSSRGNDGSSGNGAITSWVIANCTVVPATEYSGGTAGTTTEDQETTAAVNRFMGDGPGSGMPDDGMAGGNTLYDCKGAAGS